MKSQGLPINFIVLAAVGIFILILAVMFVLSGSSSATAALSPQQVRNSCNNACASLVQWATTQATRNAFAGFVNPPYSSNAQQTYCNDWTVTGVGKVYGCNNAAIGNACPVTFQDGTGCTVTCAGAGPTFRQPYC